MISWYTNLIMRELDDYYSGEETRFSEEAKEVAEEASVDSVTVNFDKDIFLMGVVDDVLDVVNIWNKNYTFHYVGPRNETNPNYKGYDGYEENAPDKATAWGLFLDYSGEYGCPDEKDYICEEIK